MTIESKKLMVEIEDIIIEIEKTREDLYYLMDKFETVINEDIIEQSQKLDKLLIKYERLKIKN